MAMRHARNVRRLKCSASACLFVCVPNRARLECHAKHLHAVDEANKQSIRFYFCCWYRWCATTLAYIYIYGAAYRASQLAVAVLQTTNSVDFSLSRNKCSAKCTVNSRFLFTAVLLRLKINLPNLAWSNFPRPNGTPCVHMYTCTDPV